jgi:hypothetical protein
MVIRKRGIRDLHYFVIWMFDLLEAAEAALLLLLLLLLVG